MAAAIHQATHNGVSIMFGSSGNILSGGQGGTDPAAVLETLKMTNPETNPEMMKGVGKHLKERARVSDVNDLPGEVMQIGENLEQAGRRAEEGVVAGDVNAHILPYLAAKTVGDGGFAQTDTLSISKNQSAADDIGTLSILSRDQAKLDNCVAVLARFHASGQLSDPFEARKLRLTGENNGTWMKNVYDAPLADLIPDALVRGYIPVYLDIGSNEGSNIEFTVDCTDQMNLDTSEEIAADLWTIDKKFFDKS